MVPGIPPPPRTPSPRAKKLIHAFAGKQFVLLLVGAIFCAVGVPLTIVFCGSLPGEVMLSVAHETVAGRVTGTVLQENVTLNGQHPTRIGFDYEVSGQTLHGESSLMNPGMLAAGDPVQIEYRASAPEIARVEGGTYGSFPVFVSFVALFPLIGLGLVSGAIRSNRREVRAFRDGHAVEGSVTFVGEDRTVRMGNRHPLKVAWSFEVQGATYQGELSSMDHSQLAEFQQGGRVTVLYVPDDPKANTLWLE